MFRFVFSKKLEDGTSNKESFAGKTGPFACCKSCLTTKMCCAIFPKTMCFDHICYSPVITGCNGKYMNISSEMKVVLENH